METHEFTARASDPILVTGAAGFIGSRVVSNLLDRGYRNVVCFVRPTGNISGLEQRIKPYKSTATVSIVRGNLLSREDCERAAKTAKVVFHLAAACSDKSYPDAFLNTVVATRNLLDATVKYRSLARFVNVSSFAVYANVRHARWRLLDDRGEVEANPQARGDAYCFAKVKQDEIVREYGEKFGIPYVIVRPGSVYGPGKLSIPARVGIDTFGLFLHLGGSNKLPLSYVDNCADAVVLSGLQPGIEGDVFNIVDDDLPSSRQFLNMHKRYVTRFRSIYIPHLLSYTLSFLWEKYSRWSEGQIPLTFNRRRWHSLWRKTRYTNEKLKVRTGWKPKISTEEGLRLYFESCQSGQSDA